MSIWHNEYNNIINFSQISKDEQNRIINLINDKNATKDGWFEFVLEKIMPHLSNNQLLDITTNIIQNGEKKGKDEAIYSCIRKSFEISPQSIKNAVNKISEPSMLKVLLLLDPNKEEEVKGLRALSTNKNTPDIIYKHKYVPSLNAMKELPPVMRLNVLETLTNGKNISYNIFQNISKSNLEDLLFPNIIRYQQRVSDMIDKFNEIQYRGQDSTITIESECERCGPYEFTLKSKSFRTETGIKSTHAGRVLLGNYCPFCYKHFKKAPIFKGQIND